MEPYPSPLRYPGGKGRLSNFIRLVYEKNNLIGGHYVEPYCGGASIGVNLLYNEYVRKIHINDISKLVYSFWFSVLNDTEDLCRLINDTLVTEEQWQRQKNIQLNLSDYSNFEIAFSTFFLNRTSWSGILTGGMIGGKHQNGKWKLDARYNKKELLRRISKIAFYRNRISLYNLDASEFILKKLSKLPKKTLVYLDPPYYLKGKELYANYYQHKDHEYISSLITKKIKQNWIVSYDNNPQINRFYKGYKKVFYSLRYSAADKYFGSEIMIFSHKLKLPCVENPVKVKVA